MKRKKYGRKVVTKTNAFYHKYLLMVYTNLLMKKFLSQMNTMKFVAYSLESLFHNKAVACFVEKEHYYKRKRTFNKIEFFLLKNETKIVR